MDDYQTDYRHWNIFPMTSGLMTYYSLHKNEVTGSRHSFFISIYIFISLHDIFT
jgi:hypothetical protein